MKIPKKLSLLLVLFIFSSYAEEVVPTVVIDAEDEVPSPLNPYSTFKTEKVSKEKFESPVRQSVADLVKDQVGVEMQTYCSNCGAKRLTINGLKGEHTSILVDGLPLHSAVSSFYGVDSIPVNGIQDINVMRGAGASQTNPEAIGGTLDLITVDPLIKQQVYSTSVSTNDYLEMSAQNHSFLISMPDENKKFGFTIGGQITGQESWDEDDNGVAESPQRKNYSMMAKTKLLVDDKNEITMRVGASDLTILGGATDATKPSNVRSNPASQDDFEDEDVEKDFIGDNDQITDWISLKRYEAAFHLTNYYSDTTTLSWNSGYARQEQDSIYQHGFDYANIDNLFVSDLNAQIVTESSDIFKTGLFFKLQRLRSNSNELFDTLDLPRDDLDNNSLATYAKYTYFASDSLEMDFALRLDRVSVNWLDLDNKVEETVLAPRFQLKHDFTEHLSQRFSYGLGYRAPLTFFESQHGNNENGYEMDITKLEKANSFVYSLSLNTPDYYITGGAHYTQLFNMAYGKESQGQPIEYVNTDEVFNIWTHDLLVGYKIHHDWMLEGSLEFFTYEDSYTEKLPTAAIERRLQLKSNLQMGPWRHRLTTTFVDSRDLSRYGDYDEHYVDRNQFPSPETRGDERKDQTAPAFMTIDTSISYQFWKKYEATFGINNLTDETQVAYADSPSAWHWHYDHAHYDGLHTWGPNRGREFYFQLIAKF